MNILIDMNLSPAWVGILSAEGWSVKHWSEIGDPAAPDRVVMDWARENGFIVFTHDLDFGIMLALTHESGPSVVQIRAQNTMPKFLKDDLIPILQQYSAELERGILMTIDPVRSRIRILPIKS